MDLKFAFVIIAMALYCTDSVTGTSLTAPNALVGQMGQPVSIRCTFETANIGDFIYISWNRIVNETLSYPLAIKKGSDAAQLVDSKPKFYRENLNVESEMVGSDVHLDLVVDGMMCMDVGLYECTAYAMGLSNPMKVVSNVTIKINPDKPNIENEEMFVGVNTTFDIRCQANVGTPPEPIMFSYARPDSGVFTLVTEGLEHATNEDESTCVTTGVSTITVTMSEDMDGARYMCYIKEADNEEFLDEVVVKLFRETTTVKTTAAPPKPTTPKHSEVMDDDNSALAVSAWGVCLPLGVLLAVLLADGRTDS